MSTRSAFHAPQPKHAYAVSAIGTWMKKMREAGSAGATGAHAKARTRPLPSSSTAASASAIPRLFGDDVLKGGPRKYRENEVVEDEKAEVTGRFGGDGGSDAADDDRNRKRQEEKRQK